MKKNQEVIQFFSQRRSSPPRLLKAPYPSENEIHQICAMGMRVPDHKKLEPWRIISMQDEACQYFAKKVEEFAPRYLDDEAKRSKIIDLYESARSVLCLVFSPKPGDVPLWEQWLSSGAVGVSLVNASLAMGYSASWMTGFPCESDEFHKILELNSQEKLIGLIHLGTASSKPPERPRPDLEEKLSKFRP